MKHLNILFADKEDLRNHLDNLWKTRSGLYAILESKPELKEIIAPQFHTINSIIGAIIEEHPYHPRTGFTSDFEKYYDMERCI